MLPLDIAVAKYLGVPRLESAHRASDSVDEDAFCDRLRLLGAKWWESEHDYMRHFIGFDELTEAEEVKKDDEEMIVGWPSKDEQGEGGVWILRVRSPKDCPESTRLRMCLDMEERCELLKTWGAIFYEDPREVEEFKEVLGKRSSS